MGHQNRVRGRSATALLLAGIALPCTVHALCLGDRHPAVKDEYASSRFVVTVMSVRRRDVASPEDPEGIEATQYAVAVRRIFKGKPPTTLTVLSENTSSRFFMQPGREYLLFGNGEADAVFVDACGHSGLVRERRDVIRELDRLADQ